MKSRRNTLIWPLRLPERQWKAFQHRHDAFIVAEARNANGEAHLLLGSEVGKAASATAFQPDADSCECFLAYLCMPKLLAL